MKTYYPMMKILREKNGFTQEQIAEQLDMNQSDYSKLETGKRKRLDEFITSKLSEIFNVSRDCILDDGNDLLSKYTDAVHSLLFTKHSCCSNKYIKRVPYEKIGADMDYLRDCFEVENVTKEMYEEIPLLIGYVEDEDQYLAFKEMMEDYDTSKFANIFFNSLKINKSDPEDKHHLYKEWKRYKKELDETIKK